METLKLHARRFFNAAYAHEQHWPKHRRDEFHLPWTFDVVVVLALLIAVVGYLTA